MRIFLAGQPQAGSGHEEELKEAFHCANDDLFSESGTQINFIRPAHKLKFDDQPDRITFLLLLALFKVRFSISSVSFGRSRKPRLLDNQSILNCARYWISSSIRRMEAKYWPNVGRSAARQVAVFGPQTREMTHAVDTGRAWGQRREPGSADARP